MSTQPVKTPPSQTRLVALSALSIALLVLSAALIFWTREDVETSTSPDLLADPAHASEQPFKPALVESAVEEEPTPAPIAQRDVSAEEAPSLHEEEALSEEAVELGYKIEELQQQGQGANPGKKKQKRKTLKPANLIVVANFDVTDVTVNGLPYPEYFEDDDKEGMVLPAGGPYDVKIVYAGKMKAHTLSFRPYETRYLVAEIPGYAGVTPPPSTPPPVKARAPEPAQEEPNKEEVKEENEEAGRITIYAKPRGDILLDGKEIGQRTPNTIESPDGRHEVQVRYEDGEISEKKVVRVRKGSRIKLFFRQRKK